METGKHLQAQNIIYYKNQVERHPPLCSLLSGIFCFVATGGHRLPTTLLSIAHDFYKCHSDKRYQKAIFFIALLFHVISSLLPTVLIRANQVGRSLGLPFADESKRRDVRNITTTDDMIINLHVTTFTDDGQ